MRKTPLFLVLLFTVVMTYGQSEIAYLIEKKSNAVLLEDDSKMTVYDFKNYDFERHYKLLIKNKNAQGLKKVVLCYSKFRKIKKASVTIRDLKGNEISKNKLNDFKDEISDLSSLASDSRCKVLSPSISKYPIVMEVEYSHSNSASLFYSSWQPQKKNAGCQITI